MIKAILSLLIAFATTSVHAYQHNFFRLSGTTENEKIRAFHPRSGGDKTIPVVIYKPTSQVESKSAIIFLSGCDGSHHLVHQGIAKHFNARGAIVAEVQSIEALGNQCGRQVTLMAAERLIHAFMARDLLVNKGLASVDNVVLVGLSHGGWTVVHAAVMDFPSYTDSYVKNKQPFAASVAVYPFCSLLHQPRREVSSPLLILGGSADTWTPLSFCRWAFEDHPKNVTIVEYNGATHAWDSTAPTRSVTSFSGTTTMSFDAHATQDGIKQSIEFIEKYMKN